MGVDFWNADKVTNEVRFNNLFKGNYATDMASNDYIRYTDDGNGLMYDSMFSNGEKISEFKADLSGDNWFSQSIKAFKKARWMASTKNPVTMNELIDFKKGFKGWNTGHNKNIQRDFGGMSLSFSTISHDKVYGVYFNSNMAHFQKSLIMLNSGTSSLKSGGAIIFSRKHDALYDHIREIILNR